MSVFLYDVSTFLFWHLNPVYPIELCELKIDGFVKSPLPDQSGQRSLSSLSHRDVFDINIKLRRLLVNYCFSTIS